MSVVSYLRLAGAHPRFLSFGFAMTFAACAGQTVIVGAFGPAVRAEYGLSHTAWSAIYMAGTLASAVILPWTGQQIDRFPLRPFAIAVCVGLVVASAFMALVPSAVFLIVAIFLLRQMGQGLASHTGKTATARFFRADRGKALAVIMLGDAVGKAVLPFIAVLLIAAIGWRATYGLAAAITAFVILPMVWWLLQGHGSQQAAFEGAGQRPAHGVAEPAYPDSWSRGQVMRDPRFYMLLPAVLAPAFVSTALFFHNLEIASVKGWSAAWMTGSYWIHAAGSIFAAFAGGPLIDRITAARVLPGFLLPLVLGLSIIWVFDAAYWVWPYLLLVGLTTGLGNTAVTSLWAEVYGVRHLGAIRSLYVSLMVFSSALGPLAMGALMDWSVSVETICAMMAVYCLAATGLMLFALNGYKRPVSALDPRS